MEICEEENKFLFNGFRFLLPIFLEMYVCIYIIILPALFDVIA